MKRLLLLGLLAASPASAWWCEGHEVVALIAEKNLNPRALAAAMKLLKSQLVDSSLPRFCKDMVPDLMADASTWADDVKKTEQTGTWHYMDLPLGLKKGDAETYCEPVGPSKNGGARPGCILSALRYNLNILHDEKESDAERAKALRYLIHLVGDLHQPLHTTANNDQGGNCTMVRFFEDPKPENLHSVWDGMMFTHDQKGRPLTQVAQDIDERFHARAAGWTKKGPEFEKWLWEGHKVAQEVVYGDLEPRVTVERYEAKPDCSAEKEKTTALHIQIGTGYETKATPIIEEQIAKAGYRLAEVLNEIWP